MEIHVHPHPKILGQAAATQAATLLNTAIEAEGSAHLILATGTSQFETLAHLLLQPVPWHRVRLFHLDEYVGLSAEHPASFSGYLWKRFVQRLPVAPQSFHPIDGTQPVKAECARLNAITDSIRFHVGLIGIGENAHLAFNDPPADFTTETAYLEVQLDDACRRQQHHEGWFPDLDSVPKTAITMSIRRLMTTKHLIVSVPEARKAQAVTQSVRGPVTPLIPASILQEHPRVSLHGDVESTRGLECI